ncbi:MAG: hypothetical protein RBU29_07535 [bacterium]|jgi:radical SAM superfamily enzyme YgiQ (UPF0313 family)|nr:hypothetical protein [bacterium]
MQKICLISLFDDFCLDARYTSSMLRHDGHQTHLILMKGANYLRPDSGDSSTPVSAHEMDLLLQAVEKQSPDLIVVFFASPAWGLAKELTQRIRASLPTPVLWAGLDSTFSPVDNLDYADMVCLGEPEYPIRHLVASMEKGAIDSTLHGIWFKQPDEIRRNPMLHLEDVIDRFPFPDFEANGKTVIAEEEISSALFPPQSHMHTNLVLRVTRTDPFTCPYCQSAHDGVEHHYDGAVRRRSVDNVIDEIKYRIQTWPTPIERIEFHDEYFPLDPDWVAYFTERYATEISYPFTAYTRPGVWDTSVFPRLKDARMQGLVLRIPTGSPAILQSVFHRQDSPMLIQDCIRQILDAGLKVAVELIRNNPLETEEDRKQTLALISSLPKGVAMGRSIPFAFYPNCTLFQPIQEGSGMERIHQPQDAHAWQGIETTETVFWDCLYTLAHFEGMEPDTLMGFSQDAYMRQKPAILQEMVQNLYNCIYLDGNPMVNKEEFIQTLRWRLTKAESQSNATPVRQVKKLVSLLRG